MDCTCTITARHLRHTECNALNTQQLVPRALDGLHKSCLSRNVRVLWFLASSRNTALPHKDVVSHLIWMNLCKAASMEMRWDCIPPGTTQAQRALRSLSTLLPSSFFFRATCPFPAKLYLDLNKNKIPGEEYFRLSL